MNHFVQADAGRAFKGGPLRQASVARMQMTPRVKLQSPARGASHPAIPPALHFAQSDAGTGFQGRGYCSSKPVPGQLYSWPNAPDPKCTGAERQGIHPAVPTVLHFAARALPYRWIAGQGKPMEAFARTNNHPDRAFLGLLHCRAGGCVPPHAWPMCGRTPGPPGFDRRVGLVCQQGGGARKYLCRSQPCKAERQRGTLRSCAACGSAATDTGGLPATVRRCTSLRDGAAPNRVGAGAAPNK